MSTPAISSANISHFSRVILPYKTQGRIKNSKIYCKNYEYPSFTVLILSQYLLFSIRDCHQQKVIIHESLCQENVSYNYVKLSNIEICGMCLNKRLIILFVTNETGGM
jgi:hypothetical protein